MIILIATRVVLTMETVDNQIILANNGTIGASLDSIITAFKEAINRTKEMTVFLKLGPQNS